MTVLECRQEPRTIHMRRAQFARAGIGMRMDLRGGLADGAGNGTRANFHGGWADGAGNGMRANFRGGWADANKP
jgi:hypothetical protein